MSSWPRYFAVQMGKILKKNRFLRITLYAAVTVFKRKSQNTWKNMQKCTIQLSTLIHALIFVARAFYLQEFVHGFVEGQRSIRILDAHNSINSVIQLFDHFSSYTFNSWFVGNCLEAFSIFLYFCLTVFLSFYLSVLVCLSSSLVHLSSS